MAEPTFHLPPITHHFQPLAANPLAKAWHLVDRDIPAYWDDTSAGHGVKIAVLDSGVDSQHPGIAKRLSASLSAIGDSGEDVQGHGTHMCGLVVDSVCGYAPRADLFSIKVLSDAGIGSERSLLRGLEIALEQDADIISMSLGSPTVTRKVIEACRTAWEQGAILTAASGNDSGQRLNYPAALDQYVLAVGAIDRRLRRAGFSNYDSKSERLDLVDFGHQVKASARGGGYSVISGTSAANALAAGALANVISLRKSAGSWSYPQVDYPQLLKDLCEDLGRDGRDVELGWGIIDPKKAFTRPSPSA